MKIIQAKNTGFCFGVRRAVDIALNAANEARKENPDARVFTFGELIHNKSVVNELKTKGVYPVESVDGLEPGSCVIIRSHGVAKHVYDELKAARIEIKDAICPFVNSIHMIVEKAHKNGEAVFIVGNPEHPECIGTNGFCDNSAVFIRSADDLSVLEGKSGCLVVQTTFDSQEFKKMADIITARFPGIEIHNTICSTTCERQREADELSRKCDAMLVLGDRHSSNTQKLKEICKKNCKLTVSAANKYEIPLEKLKKNAIMVGVIAGASTPDSIIREVINTMNEQDKATEVNCTAETTETAVPEVAEAPQPAEENTEFNEETIIKTLVPIHIGQIMTGTVVEIADGGVFVNIGYKSDGYIPRSEFSNDLELDPTTVCKIGDSIEVEVLKKNDGEGNVLLSRKNVESKKAWEEFSAKAESEDTILEGVCKTVVKGGVLVNVLTDARAFVPASLISGKHADLNELVGKPMKIKVLEVDAKRKRIVGSQKAVVRMEIEAAKKEFLESLNVGDKLTGTVRRIASFGAFVDIGHGIDGLVHITQCSWGRIKSPDEVLTPGQEIEVIVRSIDVENKRISLGYKELLPKPWTTAPERFPVGSIVEGKVVRILPFGAFVSLDPAIDGLIYIAELSLKRHVDQVEDEVSVGETVRCKVLDVDPVKKRISLSRKEAFIEEHPDEAQAFFDKEKEERTRERAERQEKRAREDQSRREPSHARDEHRRDRDEHRSERRRRDEPEYELPPVETATTSLGSLLGNLINAEAEDQKDTEE